MKVYSFFLAYFSVFLIHLVISTDVNGIACNFENNLCGWTANGFIKLPTIQSVMPYNHLHEKGNIIAYITANKGSFTSTFITANTDPFCFKFWYVLKSPTSMMTILKKEENEKSIVLLKQSYNGVGEWFQAGVTVPASNGGEKFQIVIEVESQPVQSFMDDFTYQPGACSIYGSLSNFQSIGGEYRWNDPSNKWLITNGNGSENLPTDHSLKKHPGNYAMLSSAGSSNLYGPIIKTSRSSKQCLAFWYYMNGDASSISVKSVSSSANDTLLTENYDSVKASGWKYQQLTLDAANNTNNQLVIEGNVKSPSGYVAVDDILLNESSCAPLGSCNFEHDFCTWSDDQSEVKWTRLSNTYYLSNADFEDVTKKSPEGWYIAIELNKFKNKSAELVSQKFASIENSCLSFYLNIQIDDKVHFTVNLTNGVKSSVIYETADETYGWKMIELDISNSAYADITNGDFQVKIFADIVTNQDIIHYIALDEILWKSQCSAKVNSSEITNSFNCNFENNCKWYVPWKSWEVRKPSPSCQLNCPPTDHTTSSNQGHYLILTGNIGKSFGLMKAPIVKFPQGCVCLKFWYSIMGPSTESRLNVKLYLGSLSYYEMWSRKGRQAYTWNYAQLHLCQKSPKAIIGFFATSIDNSSVAIDDISLNDGKCPTSA